MRYGSVCSGIEAASVKTCTQCRAEKPLDEFHRQPTGPLGRHSWCKVCYSEKYRGRNRPKVDPAIRRQQNFANRYGLAVSEVSQLLSNQGGVCAICGQPPTRPVVDHCHKTGAVRGILCHPCNVALAHIEDEAFRKAALRYLEVRR